MDNFKANSDESIEEFINKYPLTVPFFQEREMNEKGLKMSLAAFCEKNGFDLKQLDKKLQEHLARTVVPDSKDCYSICLSDVLCGKTILTGSFIVLVIFVFAVFIFAL